MADSERHQGSSGRADPSAEPEALVKAEAAKAANKACFDCGNTPSHWASTTYGIFLCLECAGKHRSLGTHLSKVRSISLDKWDASTAAAMVLGGNERARAAFSGTYNSIYDKYQSNEATSYAALLKSEVTARVGPASQPQSSSNTSKRPEESQSNISDARLRQYAGARSISSSDFNGGRGDDDDEKSSCWGCC